MASSSSSSSCIAPPHFSRAPKIPIFSSVPSRCDLNPARLSSFSPSHSPTRITLTAKNTLPRFTVSCSREFKAAVVTKDSWEQSVLNSQVPVLVEFYASWCGPCKMVHRVIDEIAGDYAGKLQCFVLNADVETQVAEDYDIKAVPVVLLFKNGEKRDTVVGTMPKEFYVDAIERLLKL